MSKAAAKKEKTTTTKSGSKNQHSLDGWVIAMQFLDTSWRVALPIAGLSYIGIRLDDHYGTNPRFALIGLFLSLFIATALVYKQIKTAYPDFTKKTGGKK